MKTLLAAILWLQLGWLNAAMKVEQSPPSLSIQEGEAGTIYCNHSIPVSDGLYWYRQDPGKNLESLFSLVLNGAVEQKGPVTASLDTKARRSTLRVTASQPGLSATYFCAVDAQCSPDALSLYPNLQLRWQPTTPTPPLLQGLQF